MNQRTQTTSLPTDKFLTVAINLLNKSFLEATRTDAKRLYRDLEAGKTVHLTRLQLEDKSQVRVDLTLDHREYQGSLRFATFRTGLTLLIAQIADTLRDKKSFRTYQNEHDAGSVMFGFTAVTTEDNRSSVLLLGADSQQGLPVIHLRLAYFDIRQFEQQMNAGEQLAAGAEKTEVDADPDVVAD
ncbi:MAG: hypothetical protein AAGI88_01385 [Pseudomonadota bacterium]